MRYCIRFLNSMSPLQALSIDQINLALRNVQETPNQLPMILWQYGLINLEELDKIFDWLDTLTSIH